MKRLSDTSPDAQHVLTAAYRAMTPARKWRLQSENERVAKAFHEARVLRSDPNATREEVRASWNAMILGKPVWNAIKTEVSMDRDLENIDVLREVIAVLDRLGIVYALGGSWASSHYGESRYTRDADIAVEPFGGKEEALAQAFGPDYYSNVDMIRDAVQHQGTFNLINTSAGFKVDFFVCKDRPFEQSLMSRRVQQSLPGPAAQPIFLVSPEDIILLKLEWYRLGGEASETQWFDLLGVMRTQAGQLDEAYLDRWADALGIADLLSRLRADAAV
jgi:hypothetical protein